MVYLSPDNNLPLLRDTSCYPQMTLNLNTDCMAYSPCLRWRLARLGTRCRFDAVGARFLVGVDRPVESKHASSGTKYRDQERFHVLHSVWQIKSERVAYMNDLLRHLYVASAGRHWNQFRVHNRCASNAIFTLLETANKPTESNSPSAGTSEYPLSIAEDASTDIQAACHRTVMFSLYSHL